MQQLREDQGEMQQLREDQGDMQQLREGQEGPHPVVEGQEKEMFNDGQKYHLLRNHNKPSKHLIVPSQFLSGCNGALKHGWLEKYGWWLVYSSMLDGAFCACSASQRSIQKMAQEKHVNRQPFNKSISLSCS